MTKRPIPDLEAASFVAKHTVAFLLPSQSAPGGVRLTGSGSFVTFDDRHFVLTATHVWVALRRSPVIHCSAIAEISHDFNLPPASLHSYSLDDNLEKNLGAGQSLKEFDADLTLLELHPVDRRKIEAKFSFFPLEREPHTEMNDWVMIGAPGQLAREDPVEVNTLSFEIRSIFVDTLTKEADREGLDFLRGLPYKDPICPIQNYQGMSGGGLWSLSYFPDKVADERYEVFLIGVNFWQDKEIKALGRKAIKALIQKVRRVTNSASGKPITAR